jgi:hypothetical protein
LLQIGGNLLIEVVNRRGYVMRKMENRVRHPNPTRHPLWWRLVVHPGVVGA